MVILVHGTWRHLPIMERTARDGISATAIGHVACAGVNALRAYALGHHGLTRAVLHPGRGVPLSVKQAVVCRPFQVTEDCFHSRPMTVCRFAAVSGKQTDRKGDIRTGHIGKVK